MFTNNTTNDITPEKLSPHSTDAEEAVLGSILISPDEILEVAAFLEPEDFFTLRNSWVFSALCAIYGRGEPIDYITVVEELKRRNQLDQIGGAAYITYLINNTPTHIHAETYGRIVERCSIRRRLLDAATKIGQVALAENAEIDEVIDASESQIFAISEKRASSQIVSGESAVNDALEQYVDWINDPAEVRGFRSGIPKLDSLIGGFSPGRPYTLYGATGMGKSTLASYIAVNLMQQAPGLIVTTEMNTNFWIQRAVSDLSGVPFPKLKSGQLDEYEKLNVKVVFERFQKWKHNISTLKASTPTPSNIISAARRLIRMGLCEWILVDSVNNITVPGVTEIYDVTSAAAACTQYLGVDLERVVIQTSQIGRNVKQRTNKMPQINDAEGSGKIEQNSRMVIGIYRHQYYVERGEVKPSPLFLENSTLLTILKDDTGGAGQGIPLLRKNGGYDYDDGYERRKQEARSRRVAEESGNED